MLFGNEITIKKGEGKFKEEISALNSPMIIYIINVCSFFLVYVYLIINFIVKLPLFLLLKKWFGSSSNCNNCFPGFKYKSKLYNSKNVFS